MFCFVSVCGWVSAKRSWGPAVPVRLIHSCVSKGKQSQGVNDRDSQPNWVFILFDSGYPWQLVQSWALSVLAWSSTRLHFQRAFVPAIVGKQYRIFAKLYCAEWEVTAVGNVGRRPVTCLERRALLRALSIQGAPGGHQLRISSTITWI